MSRVKHGNYEMANEKHLKKILKQGVKAWNEWIEKNPETKPDPSKAKLTWAKLSRHQDKKFN